MKKFTLLIALILLSTFTTKAQETIHYYDDFRYAGNSGYTGFATYDPNNKGLGAFITRVDGVPSDESTELGTSVLGYTRPTNNFGSRTDVRQPRSIKLSGNEAGENYEGVSWAVMDAFDISGLSNLFVSFASRNQYHEGADNDPFKVLIAKNYTDGTTPVEGSGSGEFVDITAAIKSANPNFGNDGNWTLTTLNLSTYIGDSGSDKFTLAFQFEFHNEGAFSSTNNRNGNWSISDVKFFSDASLAINRLDKDSFSIYPNPVRDQIYINNLKNIQIKSIDLLDIHSKSVYQSKKTAIIDMKAFAKGIYILKITSMTNAILTKKIIVP
ncbi:T9SS type A sorting domain-containing protein [Ochrovirga pacifica]|uniref:T9SS type A sorting domain-containing protein n=1 Tax=Ochrovirga pacifica TaxID=1042376 RepID=UPI0002558EB4|nr:T9SS type A sorting domain-containing protein [Ochrovirga pacifica]